MDGKIKPQFNQTDKEHGEKMTIHAFPSGHNPKTGMYEHGMTLRDYFAAKAMQAMLSRRESITCPDEILAQDAYNTADAMMKARNE